MNNLNTLKELVSIRSDKGCDEILKYIETKIREKVEEIIYVNNKENNKKNMLVGINTKLKDIEPVVLSGHIDTVGADEGKYYTNPYDLVIKEDKAYGLGIIDMKCFTASIIDLIEDLKDYYFPIVLAVTTDEETDLYGINSVIRKLKELNIKPKFTIIGEPTSLEIKNKSNGCYEYKIEVFGKSCHSSTPKEGINSICVLSRIVTYIEELSGNYNNLTMSCDLISGGTIINRVPDYATMSFDVRTTNINNYIEVIDLIQREFIKLEKKYNCIIKINNELKIPPLSCKNNSKIETVASNVKLNVGQFAGGCEAGYYQEYSGDVILFGVGDLSLAHKPNEYMIVDDYRKYNNKLKDIMGEIEKIYYKKI